MNMKTTYWITTAFVSCIMGISGILAAAHAGPMMTALAHLGYPRYFADLLGVAKLSAVCVLLLPALGRLKEWAYAGCAITILSASYSHLISGDGLRALEPLISFAALVVSYLTRPSDRRFILAHARPIVNSAVIRHDRPAPVIRESNDTSVSGA